MKIVKKNSVALTSLEGLPEICEKITDEKRDWSHRKNIGTVHKIDVMPEYIQKILSYVNVENLKPFKVVINSENGSAGPIINELEKFLPFEIVKVFNDTDGDFPNGVPNPLLKETHAATTEAILEIGADCGVAFDGDCDRCFLFDEKGNFIEGYYIVGFLAETFLKKNPGEKIIYEPRVYWNTTEIVKKMGGDAVMCRLGHSFIKSKMREENAIYGGEMSAHHYFRDFYYCDSGMIPWLMALELLSLSGRKLSELLADRIAKYPASGEINTKVASIEVAEKIIRKIGEKYGKGAKKILKVDGLGVDYNDWRFNLRGSKTEPYIRLNVETRGDKNLLEQKTEELLAIIRG